MTADDILSWCRLYHARIDFGLYDYVVYVVGFHYRVSDTLEGAITAMQEQMRAHLEVTMVEGHVVKQLAEVEQMLLLAQGSED